MTSMLIGLMALFLGFVAIVALLALARRQFGGGLGPTELSDGRMTTTPTGYPEEMKGKGKEISATDNNAAKY